MAGGATVDSGALDALEGRSSVRGYLDRPVPRQLVERILTAAARAPSGNNSQPWRVHVLTGSARARIGDVILAAWQANHDQADPAPEYDYYPQDWPEPYRVRRRTNGLGLYGLLGIQKGDKAMGGRGDEVVELARSNLLR
jgi:nitroreductase